jgi:hypothetical protein
LVEAHHLEAVMAEFESSHGGIPKVFQAHIACLNSKSKKQKPCHKTQSYKELKLIIFNQLWQKLRVHMVEFLRYFKLTLHF